MSLAIVIDGRVVDAASARISVLDRGLLYGDGLFEVLRTWNGRAIDLDAHLDRLADSARWLRLPIDRAAIAHAVQLAIGAASAIAPPTTSTTSTSTSTTTATSTTSSRDYRIRIVVTRGPGGLAVPMASAGPGHTIVIAEPLGALTQTMSLALVEWALPERVGRGHKTLAYLDHIIAKELARERGADDAVRLDASGKVVEGGTCNVFAVIGGVVFGASDGFAAAPGFAPDGGDDQAERGGVLPGVTAARVVSICRQADIPVVIGPIEVTAFLAADEVFATSAIRGVVAVTRLISDGERDLPCGVLTSRIRAAYVGAMSSL